jgi:predicted DNA-binding transcriptional regulator AlpA
VLQALGGINYVTLWEKIRRGQFPAGYVLWNNVVKWRSDEVEAWLADRLGPDAKKQKLLGMPGHTPLAGKKRGRKPKASA